MRGRVLLLAALLGCTAVAQIDTLQRATIRGIVEDERTARAGTLSVTLRSNDGLIDRQVQTSGTGDFEFPSVPSGTYVVQVTDGVGNVLARQVVDADGPEPLRLRIGERATAQPPSGTVSARAVRVKVPSAAVKELRKASQLEQGGDVPAALDHLHRAVEICPDFAGAHNNLGIAYLRLNRAEEAVGEFRTAQRLDPGTALYSANLGAGLAAVGDYAGAVTAEREALREDPGQSRARYVLGMALHALGQLRDALKYLREAAADMPSARFQAARVLADLGQRGEAAAELRRYLASPGEVRDRPQAEQWLAELERQR
jgi:Flp pilus assembly protein TadD